MDRREMIVLLGTAGIDMLMGCSPHEYGNKEVNTVSLSCVATPQQTEGPYFVDARLYRSDIRIDPSDGSMKEGLSLDLKIRVSVVSKVSCEPLVGALVDIWHCDAEGVYSDVLDQSFNTIGKKFLRGYQISDATGSVQFTTIYPGWYEGRTVHVHFKIRSKQKPAQGYEFTSQFYFQDSITDQVHAKQPYIKRGHRAPRNEGDRIFLAGGDQLILALIQTDHGYATTFDVGLVMD